MHKPVRLNATKALIAHSLGKLLVTRFNALARPVSPSDQQEFARSTLERAGFKVGPGVDLKMK